MTSLKELRQVARDTDLHGMVLGRCDYCEMVDLAGKQAVKQTASKCYWCGRGKVTMLADSPAMIRRWLKNAATA